MLKFVNPGTAILPAKVHRDVLLDEIYDVFPYFLDPTPLVHKHIPLADSRFSNLRQVVQTSKQDLDGMYRLPDLLTYNDPDPLIAADRTRTPNSPLVRLVTPDLREIRLSHEALINVGYFVGIRAGINEEVFHLIPSSRTLIFD